VAAAARSSLERHNELRALHGALPMVWDNALARAAQVLLGCPGEQMVARELTVVQRNQQKKPSSAQHWRFATLLGRDGLVWVDGVSKAPA